MRYVNFIILIIIALFFTSFSLPAADEDELVEKALEAKKFLFERNYEEGMRVFKGLQERFPESPTGLFGEMAIWQIRMFENYDFRFKEEYEDAEKRYIRLATKILRRGGISDWDLFVCAAADGLRGFFKTREGKWWGALHHGLHAHRLLKQLLWRSPNFVDAYLGLGLYDYWRSKVTKDVKFLPIFSDRREQGIAEIRRVMNEGRYAKDLAKGNLGMVYYEEKRFGDAIEVLVEMAREYPRNIIIRMLLGRSYLMAKRYQDALAVFEEIQKIDKTVTKALYYKGVSLWRMKGELKKAKRSFYDYLATDPEPEWAASAHYYIGQILEQEKDIEGALAEYKRALEVNRKMEGAKKAVERLLKML